MELGCSKEWLYIVQERMVSRQGISQCLERLRMGEAKVVNIGRLMYFKTVDVLSPSIRNTGLLRGKLTSYVVELYHVWSIKKPNLIKRS